MSLLFAFGLGESGKDWVDLRRSAFGSRRRFAAIGVTVLTRYASPMWSRHSRRWIATVVASSLANGVGLAEPLDKPVTGPKLICFKYSTFMLDEDEQISDFSGSPEAMSIAVNGPASSYKIGESDIFASPRGSKRLVASSGGTTVYRVSDHGGRYAIFGRTTFSKEKDRLVIWLSGKGLKGRKSDASVYDRFEVRDPAGVKCDRTFTYSWGF